MRAQPEWRHVEGIVARQPLAFAERGKQVQRERSWILRAIDRRRRDVQDCKRRRERRTQIVGRRGNGSWLRGRASGDAEEHECDEQRTHHVCCAKWKYALKVSWSPSLSTMPVCPVMQGAERPDST
jgi:hypothetical protein